MRIKHRGNHPLVNPSAWVAPTAILSGAVTLGPHSRVLHGAVLTAEGGSIVLGEHCIVMETAVVRGSKRHPVKIGNHVLIGPRAYLSGCCVEDCAFIATGAAIFNGAIIGARAEVRVNATVHVNTHLAADATVPIGWIAVGRPARLFPPSAHEELSPIQKALDFPGTVFGLARPQASETIMPELTRRYAKALLAHRDDKTIEDE